jgi:hypothetical protein
MPIDRAWRGIGMACAVLLAIGRGPVAQARAGGNTPPMPSPGTPTLGAHTVLATSLTADDVGVLPALGSIQSGAVPMLGKAIALPSGSWRVVATQKSTFDGYPPGASVTLVRASDGALTGALQIAGNAVQRPSHTGWPLNPVCAVAQRSPSEPRVLAAEAGTSVAGGPQDCLVLTSEPTASWRMANAPTAMQALARAIASLKLQTPPLMGLIAFGQTSRTSRLTEQLWLAAPTPEHLPPPGGQGWTATQVAATPPLAAWRRRLLSWAKAWRPVVRQSLSAARVDVSAHVAQIQ